MKTLLGIFIGIVIMVAPAYSAEVLWNNRLEGNAVYGGQLWITDGDFNDLNVAGAFVDAKTHAYIRLGLGEVPEMVYTSIFTTYHVNVKITPFSNLGDIQPSFTQTLTAEYSVSQGGSVTIDADDYRMTGVHKFLVEVVSVTINGTTATSTQIPNYVYLEAGVYAERYYQLNETTGPLASHKFVTYSDLGIATYVNSSNQSVDEYELVWDYVAGAEYYDLEWTWVDNYSATSLGVVRPITDPTLTLTEQEFNHNSTRVRLSGQSYRIPQTFAEGYIVYRVRGVGRWMDANALDKYGKWSGNSTTKAILNDWGTSNIITVIQSHEDTKNWQYQATYAENGKKKEVAQYFDGSLRGRQTVTRINSDNQSVVGETVYDNEGRGVIQVLPVPQKNPAIKYYPDLNNNAGSETYSHKDFDWELTNPSCETSSAAPMSPTTGASNYYSPGSHTTDSDWQQYVPDAQSFPFTQVEYTPDNTGRIRNQSGVGVTHKIGGGHETFYYYLQPSQEELDRLFGYKVGYKNRYKKNMVVDANGQVSISYLDAQGRVIATALSGDNSTAFGDLDSENGMNHLQASTDLLNKVNTTAVNSPSDDNILFSTGHFGALEDGLKMGTQIGVIQDGSVYNFNYTVQTDNFEYSCNETTLSYPFVYDLKLSFRDDCGSELFTNTFQGVGVEQIGALTGTTVNLAETVTGLKQGSYTLFKEITVNEASLEAYKAHFLSTANTCLLDSTDFYDAVAVDCGLSCQECVDELGTLNAFLIDAASDEGHVLSGSETTAYTALFNQLFEDCVAPCVPLSSCDVYHSIMMGDLKPGGQYGGLNATDPLSVFNEANILAVNAGSWRNLPLGNQYQDEFGNLATIPVLYDAATDTYTPALVATADPAAANGFLSGIYEVEPINLLNVTDFMTVFQDSWAEALLPMHPEYPLYLYALEICNNKTTVTATSTTTTDPFTISSETFNDIVSNKANTYAQANNLEVSLDGLDFYTLNLLQNNDLMAIDPFFNQSYTIHQALSSNATTLKNALMNHAMTNYENSNMSMLRYAAKTVLCGNDYNGSCIVNGTSWSTLATNYPTRMDEIWQTYKSYYLSYKAKINQLFMDVHGFSLSISIPYEYSIGNTTTISTGIFNGAIGIGSMNIGIAPAFYEDATNYASVFSLAYSHFFNPIAYAPLLIGPIVLTSSLYDTKVIRITRIDALYNPAMSDNEIVEELTQDADYETWEGTGLCPLTNDMERLLDALGRNNQLMVSTSMDYIPEMVPDLFTTLTGMDPNPASEMTISGTAGGAGTPLNLVFSSIGPISTQTVVLPELHSTLPWSTYGVGGTWKIYSISNSFPVPNTNNVKILVKAGPTLDIASAQEYVITYQSPINLNSCQTDYASNGNLDANCPKEEELEAALQTLMQKLLQNGTLLNTGVSLAAMPEYYQSVLPNYLGTTSPTWSGPNVNNILGITAGTNGLVFALTSALPTNIQLINSVELIGTTIYINLMANNTTTAREGTYIYELNGVKPSVLDLSCPCEPETSIEEALEAYVNYIISLPPNNIPLYIHSEEMSELGVYLSVLNPSTFTFSNSSTFFSVKINSDCGNCEALSCLLTINGQSFPIVSVSNIVFTTSTTFTCEALLTNGSTLTLTGNLPCAQAASPCDDCGPQLQEPLSCNTAFDTYITFMNTQFATGLSTDDLVIFNQEYLVSEQVFCENQYAYISTAYSSFISTLAINSVLNTNYLSISEFGSTPLGYSNTLLTAAKTAYFSYIGIAGNQSMTWNDYVATVYMPLNPGICPASTPQTPFPNDLIEFPCNQWETAVASVNQQTQYGIYMAQIAASFTQDYVETAISSLIETFTENHLDKEYHYTLYYYDRAGNLIQTVPPQGVDRLEVGEVNTVTYDQMDALRVSNPAAIDNTINGIKNAPEHTFETSYRYNSLNQLVYQSTPDGGVSRFAYDRLGRLVMSQNAKQAALSPERFSYTKYDELGRVSEVGELISNSSYNYEINEIGGLNFNATPYTGLNGINATNFPDNIASTRVEVTRTIYDELKFANGTTPVTVPLANATTPTIQSLFGASYAANNTRNRIVGVIYQNTYVASMNTYVNATFYDYDVHGNVSQMIQINADPDLVALDQHIKYLNYNYDLVSGNVNKVIYQKGYVDQFIHRYQYDSDNRIVVAETSKDNVFFEKDAKYFYYDHGPLARTEIGDKKVVATDYAYTIQGWLKAVNGEEIDPTKMMGADGKIASGNLNLFAGRDVFGFSLNYFKGDYNSNNTDMIALSQNTAMGNENQLWKNDVNVSLDRQYYNGNIRAMHTAISGLNEQLVGNFDNGSGAPQPTYTHRTIYEYDQLNRILSMNGYQAITPGITPVSSNYKSEYSFDANGNIKTMKRWVAYNNASSLLMDDFAYKYLTNSNVEYDPTILTPANATNRLGFVDDLAGVSLVGDADIDNTMNSGNYEYDLIGQLTKDIDEGISSIEWTVTNKVKKVIYASPSNKIIEFTYDAMGNRITKKVTTSPTSWDKTFYVLDAQGNPMSTYTQNYVSGSNTILYLSERNIYGSSRVGVEDLQNSTILGMQIPVSQPANSHFTNLIGDKAFELANHLGNVLNVVTDRKLAIEGTGVGLGTVSYYTADVISYSDYDPFGMLMPNRHEQENSYKYGFNGMEKDDEIKNNSGTSYDFGARIYDPRVGRWLSRDRKEKSYTAISPYTFGLNNPIFFIDPDGNIIIDANGNVVTINKDSDGNITGFNDDIPDETKEFLTYYLGSETGKSALQKMDATKTKITVRLAEEAAFSYDSESEKFSPIAGITSKKEGKTIEEDGTETYESVTITLYKGSHKIINGGSDALGDDEKVVIFMNSEDGEPGVGKDVKTIGMADVAGAGPRTTLINEASKDVNYYMTTTAIHESWHSTPEQYAGAIRYEDLPRKEQSEQFFQIMELPAYMKEWELYKEKYPAKAAEVDGEK